MKKLLLVLVVGAGALASCSKNYTCECTYTDTNNGTVSTYTDEFTIEEASKTQAENACIEAIVKETDSDGDTYERLCELSK